MSSDNKIQFQCSNCGRTLKSQAEHAGRTVSCPVCKTQLVVPNAPEISVEPMVVADLADASTTPSSGSEARVLPTADPTAGACYASFPSRQFTVYRRLGTTEPASRVMAAIEHSLRVRVGGTVRTLRNRIQIENGTSNVNFSFMGDLSATIVVTQPKPGIVEIQGTITLKPNTMFWICGIVGFFCLWFLWIANGLYFIIDPRGNYQSALDSIDLSLLDQADQLR